MNIFGPLLLAISIAGHADGQGADWPHLRGPGHDGRAASSVFEEGDFSLSLAWKAPMGAGYSGIAVADGTLVTMCADGELDVVVALDAASGAPRWRHALGPAYRGHDGSDDGPLSTPLIHRGMVYALGPRGRLVALELAGGVALWSCDFVADFGSKPPEYGFATTPLADEDLIIVQTGGPQGRSLAGLDARSGVQRWISGDEPVEYQSPLIMSLAGRRQLVAFRGTVVAGHDPQTGELLWRHELGEREAGGAGVPIPVDDHRFLALVGSGLAVFEVKRDQAQYTVDVVLRCREFGNAFCPPVQCGDHLYGLRGDFLTCVDARTGERRWKSRPPGGHGLLVVNDHLVILGAEGRVVVAAATPEGYREEADLQVFDRSGFTWPSFADGRIFVRSPREIASIAVVRGRSAPGAALVAQAPPESEFSRFIEGLKGSANPQEAVNGFMAGLSVPIVEGSLVHFVYRGPASEVAIGGPITGGTRPDPLVHVAGTDLHYRTYRLEPGSRMEYGFQVDYESLGPDPLNPRIVPGTWNDLSEVVLHGYPEPLHIEEPAADSRGRLETFGFESPKLEGPRQISVYLPRAYDRQKQRRFPLLVVTDGRSWLEKGLLQNTLDNLIGKSLAPLVVALVDPIDMWWLEAGGSRTAVFADVLADELVPELERRYRLQSRPLDRALLGATDHGLTAAYTALKHPDVFGQVAVQSVGLHNGAQDELLQLIERQPRAAVQFYVDWNLYEAQGTHEGFDYGADSRALMEALRKSGYVCTGGEARDTHGWSSWRARTDRILESFFPLSAAAR